MGACVVFAYVLALHASACSPLAFVPVVLMDYGIFAVADFNRVVGYLNRFKLREKIAGIDGVNDFGPEKLKQFGGVVAESYDEAVVDAVIMFHSWQVGRFSACRENKIPAFRFIERDKAGGKFEHLRWSPVDIVDMVAL